MGILRTGRVVYLQLEQMGRRGEPLIEKSWNMKCAAAETVGIGYGA